MTIFDLERTSPFKIQADFARWATFGFNEELVGSIIPSIMDSSQLELFILIIRNKHLLSKNVEPIEVFLRKVDSIEKRSNDEEVLKLFTKSGIHILKSDTMLSDDIRFVSKNEPDYVIRTHVFPMAIYNASLFGFINEDLATKTIACRPYIANDLTNKKDVASVSANYVTMVNGDVYKLVIVV